MGRRPLPTDPLSRAEARYALYARMMERAGLLASHYLHEVRRLRAQEARMTRSELEQARRALGPGVTVRDSR